MEPTQLQVYGPNVWFRTSINRKIINVFGEEHKPVTVPQVEQALHFSEALQRACTYMCKNNITCDIFLENSFSNSEDTPPENLDHTLENGSALIKTNIDFADCMGVQNSRFPGIRFHYTNIRSLRKYKCQGYSQATTYCSMLARELEKTILHLNRDCTNGEEAVSILQKIEKIRHVENYTDLYLGENSPYPFAANKLKKQLNAIPKYSQFVRDYFLPKCEKAFLDVKNVVRSELWQAMLNTSLKKEILSGYIFFFKFVSGMLTTVDSILNDIYIMARFFRTYEWSGTDPILIFGGAKHTARYRAFFYETFDSTPSEAYENKEGDCITGEHFHKLWSAVTDIECK